MLAVPTMHVRLTVSTTETCVSIFELGVYILVFFLHGGVTGGRLGGGWVTYKYRNTKLSLGSKPDRRTLLSVSQICLFFFKIIHEFLRS